MGRVCTICALPPEQREEIDKALIGGEPVTTISHRYSPLSPSSISRHRDEHLPAMLAKGATAREATRADALLGEVQKLKNKAISLLLKAEQAGDYRTALAGIREARACLELLLEVEGEIDRRPVVNLVVSAEWQQTRAIILRALIGHPEARQAVVMALSAPTGHQG